MKRWNLILLLLVLAAGLAIGAGVSMLHNGLSARTTPTAMEAMLARNARHLAIPANARNEHNPVTPSVQNLQEAMAHFADHCAPCHGNDGSGDTPYGKGYTRSRRICAWRKRKSFPTANYSGSSKTESASLACRPLAAAMDRRTTGNWYSSFGICRN